MQPAELSGVLAQLPSQCRMDRLQVIDRSSASEPSSDLADVDDIPPAVSCATCGLTDCESFDCATRVRTKRASSLPWESGQFGLGQRFWSTARQCSAEPELAFGQLQRGSLLAPLTFALLSELLALGSLLLSAALTASAFWPRLVGTAWHSASVWLLGLTLWVLLAVGMVAVHLLWGWLLERGVEHCGDVADYNLGLRFGLYACGWDALTSPGGLVLSAMAAGRPGLRAAVGASRVPRTAMDRYLRNCRGLTEEQTKVALRFSLLWGLLGGGVLSLLAIAGLVAVLTPG